MWQRSAIESDLSLLLWESVYFYYWLLLFQSQVFFFFFKGFRIPNLLGEGIYMKKKEPTNKVKSKNKDEERNGKGRRKNGGCDQSNFLWRGIALLGLSGSVPGLQLKVNFFYWIPSRDIITSKGYYYPEGFRLNHLSVTFKMQEVTIVWHHGTCQGPSFQTIVYIILPPTLLRWKHWKHFHCRPFYLSRCRGKKKKKSHGELQKTKNNRMPWRAIFKHWLFECALEGNERTLGFN